MSLFKLNQPRRFNFQPRSFRAEDKKKIRFRRITHYDPHEYSRLPLRSLIIVVLIGLLILILGGLRPHLKTPTITSGDAVNQPVETNNE